MYKRVRQFIELHINQIGAVLVITVLILWTLSQYVPALKQWIMRQDLLGVIIIVLLVDAITRLVELKYGGRPGWVRVFKTQADAYPEVRQFIIEKRPAKADLLECSSATIVDLLEQLRRARCEIRLLLQHPKTATTEFQRNRIKERINCLLNVEFAHSDSARIQIRCYCAPASLRGRNLDDTLISLGWYTYTLEETELRGHSNPMVNAYADSEDGRYLHEMFNREFNRLWNHSTTVSVQDVL